MGKLAKYISIELDKPRKLLYDLNAMAAYEEKTGKSFLEISKEPTTAGLIRVVLWAGLLHEDEALTIKQVGAMITAENMLDIQKKIADAASANVSSKEDDIDPNANPSKP